MCERSGEYRDEWEGGREGRERKEGWSKKLRQEKDEPGWIDGGIRKTGETGTGKGTSRSHP